MQSLRRMNTDYVDLLQFHFSPSEEVMVQNEAIECIKALQAQGKVRWIGMSGTYPELSEQIAMDVFDTFQIPYSALEREHEDLTTQASQAGAGTVIRGGVAQGSPGQESGDAWAKWQEAGLADLVGDMTPIEFMLRFTASHAHVDTIIVGTADAAHLEANVAALLKGPLPADVYDEALKRLTAVGIKPI